MEDETKKKNRKGAEIWALKSFRDRSSFGMEVEFMVGYYKTIEIIENIVERYNDMIPDIFKKLNSYEKELQTTHKRHVFCKQDCLNVMKQNRLPLLDKRRLDVVSEAFLLLYNWYKAKIIYHIEEEAINQNISIDREKLKLFPYSGIYLDLNFYTLGYEGCFVSLTKEKRSIHYADI